MRSAALLLAVTLLVAGCSSEPADPGPDGPPSGPTSTPSVTATPDRPEPPEPPPPVRPDDVRIATATGTVRHLAGRIGPRMATGPAYDRAATWVERRLTRWGYDVRREPFRVPAGTSWGVPVDAGTSRNLVAARPGFERTEPHLVVGAHLDTVPQAPGAEDNASGVGVLLAVAEALRGRRTRLPVVLVVFGAEEPRGESDDDHHYGSQHHVARLGPTARRALRGMLSLDRVGVGEVMPVCSAGAPDRLRAELLAAARRAGVPTEACTDNRSSDHWSFVRNGLPGVRLGSTPFAGYHSEGDVPPVVDPGQLERAARITLSWLSLKSVN